MLSGISAGRKYNASMPDIRPIIARIDAGNAPQTAIYSHSAIYEGRIGMGGGAAETDIHHKSAFYAAIRGMNTPRYEVLENEGVQKNIGRGRVRVGMTNYS